MCLKTPAKAREFGPKECERVREGQGVVEEGEGEGEGVGSRYDVRGGAPYHVT